MAAILGGPGGGGEKTRGLSGSTSKREQPDDDSWLAGESGWRWWKTTMEQIALAPGRKNTSSR